MGPRWGQDAVKIKKKDYRNKKEGASHSPAPVEPKKWPTWPQLGSQVVAKMG